MDLIGFLKSNEDARKVFGEREIKIVEKQLKGITLTQSEKNRLSRDIRKKLKFIKDASRYSKDFQLKKGKYLSEKIDETIEIILDDKINNKIKKIMQFGSTLDGTMRLNSDLDLAVEFTDIELSEATEFLKRINGEITDKIDITVFNTVDEKIKKEIQKQNKILFEK